MKNSGGGDFFFCFVGLQVPDHLRGSLGNIPGFVTMGVFLKLVSGAEYSKPISLALIHYSFFRGLTRRNTNHAKQPKHFDFCSSSWS